LDKLQLKRRGNVMKNREWKVFLIPSAHVDVGYNFLQAEALKNHEESITIAIETCKVDSIFKWNLESAWVAQKYLHDYPERTEEFVRLVRNGQIGIQPLYLNMLTGIMSHEELNRICYFAGLLKRKYGIPLGSAMFTDAPSAIWTLPTVLALSGVKYLAHGVNPFFDRGPFYPRTNVKPLFWWQGPDGSKILTWIASGYAQACEILQIDKGCAHIEQTLPKFLTEYERSDYPYDAVLVYGAYFENKVVDPNFRKAIEEWNSKHEYPKLIISTGDEFFKYVENNFQDKIPIYVGDEGCWWEDGVASSACEISLDRSTHENIITAEKIWSLISLLDPEKKYPLTEFNDIWEKIFLFDEHTWGANKSIMEPEAKFVQDQWKIKSSFIYSAAKQTDILLDGGFKTLVSLVETKKPTILVFNPLSWKRTDVVEVKLELSGRRFDLTDSGTNKSIPYQWIEPNTICFLASNVPPIGFKKYELVYSKEPVSPELAVKFFDDGMENKFYRIQLDPTTGGIVSIYDKQLKCEFVDGGNKYKLNQYIYVKGGEGTLAVQCKETMSKIATAEPRIAKGLKNMMSIPEDTEVLPPPDFKFFSPTSCKIHREQNGPIFGEILVEASCERTPKIKQRIILYNGIKRIDLINEFDKEETYEKEAVYFAFPFKFKDPEFKIEIPNGIMRPEKDQLRGACRDWYCVQHWVSVSDKNHSVILATPDSPLICFQQINIGKWAEKLEMKNGSVLTYVMNNYWHTNYKASQKGGKFRYSITTCSKDVDNIKAIYFGWNYSNPLLSSALPPHQKGKLKDKTQSFCSVDKPNAVVLTIKLSEDKKGWIIRLFETEGKTTELSLRLPPLKFNKAYLCNLIEEELKPLFIERNEVKVLLPAHGIVTIKLH
jgi:hypothetical protein